MRYIVSVDVALTGGRKGQKVMNVSCKRTVIPRHLATQILLDTPGAYRVSVHSVDTGQIVGEA